MSGGHFDYKCFNISQFADELQHEIDINNSTELDEYGETIGRNYSKDTLSLLIASQKLIEYAGKLAHEVEWLLSGDHGEASFEKLYTKLQDYYLTKEEKC